MSKKERDIWDDAIRSKLEDFEMDTLPGDWEAIADRLPGKAPVPLRRTLRYWVAAAVISLLVVSGGIYLYDREMEDLPIAQEIQSSQESTSVDTPVVPIEKTMEQAPVLATIPAAAVVKAKAASGAVKVGAKARMAAFRQNVESAEDRPISESEVMSADNKKLFSASTFAVRNPLPAEARIWNQSKGLYLICTRGVTKKSYNVL